jgi:pimeloyl-ACP methyl ester carboxylesterase
MSLFSGKGFRRSLGILAIATISFTCSKEIFFVPSKDNVPIAYETYGFGKPAIVFVHGWSCDRTYWREQIKPFLKKYEVVALDLGGHGQSGNQRDDWTIESFGSDVASVVERLSLTDVILVGHSMGGDAIVAAAQQLGAKVKGLIWVDVYRQLGTYRTPEQIDAFIAPFRNSFRQKTDAFVRTMFPTNADQALVNRIAKDMSSATPEIALNAMRSAISYDRKAAAALQQIDLPVIAINAAYPPTDTASLKKFGVKSITMANVGHFLMLEKPEEFNALLFRAVDELRGE